MDLCERKRKIKYDSDKISIITISLIFSVTFLEHYTFMSLFMQCVKVSKVLFQRLG